MHSAVKADARRIPDRYNNNQEIDAVPPTPMPWPEPEPEPVAALPEPEPEPVEVVVEQPVEEIVEEVIEVEVTPPTPKPRKPEPVLAEVEYTWQDAPHNGNGHHAKRTAAAPLRLNPWPAEPMIHRPDWW
jgi:hypothetical protein